MSELLADLLALDKFYVSEEGYPMDLWTPFMSITGSMERDFISGRSWRVANALSAAANLRHAAAFYETVNARSFQDIKATIAKAIAQARQNAAHSHHQ